MSVASYTIANSTHVGIDYFDGPTTDDPRCDQPPVFVTLRSDDNTTEVRITPSELVYLAEQLQAGRGQLFPAGVRAFLFPLSSAGLLDARTGNACAR